MSNFDFTRHRKWLTKKYVGSLLAFNTDTQLWDLYLVIRPSDDFYIDVSLYPSIVEVRFSDFKLLIARLIRMGEKEMRIEMEERNLVPKKNTTIH